MIRFNVDLGPDSLRGEPRRRPSLPTARAWRTSCEVTSGLPQIATRLLDQVAATTLAGTENAELPFFSPDGQWIGFFADQKMKKISVQGGAAVTLCDTSGPPRGGSWGEDGFIIVNLDNFQLARVPSAGGKPELVGEPGKHGERTWRWPQVVNKGQTVLFTGTAAAVGSGYEDANIEALSLKTGQVKVLQRGGYFGRYLPTGHLTYLHQGTMFAVPFDLDRLESLGPPVPVVEDVAGVSAQGGGQLDFSQTGTLVYLSGKGTDAIWTLSWIDPSGKGEAVWAAPSAILTPKLSPDGKRIAGTIGPDVYVFDIARAASTRLTFNAASRRTLWSPDGKHLVYSTREGNGFALSWIRADGSSQPHIIYSVQNAPNGLLVCAFILTRRPPAGSSTAETRNGGRGNRHGPAHAGRRGPPHGRRSRAFSQRSRGPGRTRVFTGRTLDRLHRIRGG